MAIKAKDMTEEQARATINMILEKSNLALSIHWLVIGILVGVCGNIVTSGLFELIKLFIPIYWPWVFAGVSVVALIPLIYYSLEWRKSYKELTLMLDKKIEEFGPWEDLLKTAYGRSDVEP